MSLYGALNTGVSGLAAQSNALGMISDNIANVNTVGYKDVNARFSTFVTQSGSVSKHSPGGVRSAPYSRIQDQGLVQGTSSKTDMAVVGDGFFVVNEAANPGLGNSYLYTRAGSFSTDSEGNLVNAGGYYLQGYNLRNGAAPTSTTSFAALETVNIGDVTGSASATSTIGLVLNLPSTAAVNDTHDVTVQVYDSFGNGHDMNLTFEKTAANQWSFTTSDPTLDGAASGTAAGAGTITFNGDGTPSAVNVTTPFAVTGWTTGADDSALTLDLGTVGQGDGVSQFAGDFSIYEIERDGARYGVFTDVQISEQGLVTAIFDNGNKVDLYQLPLANFNNPNGLENVNGNAFKQTDQSGGVQLNLAQNGGAGLVSPSSLEGSTVDIADEFTNMIVTQRAYSANARVITTADDMLEELMRVKR